MRPNSLPSTMKRTSDFASPAKAIQPRSGFRLLIRFLLLVGRFILFVGRLVFCVRVFDLNWHCGRKYGLEFIEGFEDVSLLLPRHLQWRHGDRLAFQVLNAVTILAIFVLVDLDDASRLLLSLSIEGKRACRQAN